MIIVLTENAPLVGGLAPLREQAMQLRRSLSVVVDSIVVDDSKVMLDSLESIGSSPRGSRSRSKPMGMFTSPYHIYYIFISRFLSNS